MEINSLVGSTTTTNVTTTNSTDSTNAGATAAASSSAIDDTAAVYTPGESGARKGMSAAALAEVDKAVASATDPSKFTDMVRKMLGQQTDSSGKQFGLLDTDLSFATGKAKTADDIAAEKQDDYWSADKTSARILNFAKALSGGDPSKISILKDAAVKGFQEAMGCLGKDMDSMPKITQDTYNAVIKGFDDWAKQSSTSTDNTDSTTTAATSSTATA